MRDEKYSHEARWLEEQGLTYGSVFSVKEESIARDSRKDAFPRISHAKLELHLENPDRFIVEDSIIFKDVPMVTGCASPPLTLKPSTRKTATLCRSGTKRPCTFTPLPSTHTWATEVCPSFTRAKRASKTGREGLERAVQGQVQGVEFVLCRNEATLLQKFILAVRRFAPDVLGTYNGNGYDWPFVLHRCLKPWGFPPSSACSSTATRFRAKTYDSAAAGRDSWEVVSFPHLHPFTREGKLRRGGHSGIPGVLLLDMYKIVQDSHKLSSYKLDFVARELLGSAGIDGLGKVQLSYAEQRRLHLTEVSEPPGGQRSARRKAPKTRCGEALAKIVEYVAQDAHLVQRLMDTTLTLSKTVAPRRAHVHTAPGRRGPRQAD